MLWRTGGVMPLIVGSVTVVMSIASFGALYEGLAFEAQGVVSRAEIMDRSTRRVRSNDRTKTEYSVLFRYDVEGHPREMRRKVSRRLYEESLVGTSRRVRYLPERPDRVEFQIGSTMESGRAMRWIALVLGVVTLVLLWWKGGRAVDAVRARKFGAQERVTVLDVSVTRINTGRLYRLKWVDQNGVEGTSLASGKRNRYEAYPPQSQVDIFRGAKGRAWWVGDVGPRAQAGTVPSVAKS